jgi:hypothetical protein
MHPDLDPFDDDEAPLRLDSTSIGIEVEPYVTALARRVLRARWILSRQYSYPTEHRWARRQLADARDYLINRKIRLPQ